METEREYSGYLFIDTSTPIEKPKKKVIKKVIRKVIRKVPVNSASKTTPDDYYPFI